MPKPTTEGIVLSNLVHLAIRRGLISVEGSSITYHLRQRKKYRITDPEEQVRADTIAFLVIEKGYEARMMDTEVVGSHGNFADIVLFSDDECKTPYLVVENKKRLSSQSELDEGVSQAFANANALRARYALLDCGDESTLYNVADYPPLERRENVMGDRDALCKNFEKAVAYRYWAGDGENDIVAATSGKLERAVKQAHAIVWAGGKRDPLVAFDEWSKLMLAKVHDERFTENGSPRLYQQGIGESDASTATRIHELFQRAAQDNRDIFPEGASIDLPDAKVAHVVRILQGISFVDTDADTIGVAFEGFYGSVFRGQLGQYFTMRPIARFVVAALDLKPEESVLDPTCGSGGFLLEALLQTWARIDGSYSGRSELGRIKSDYASRHVYGVEIHETLARICKISLMLHHDGHSNIEADKSCLSPHLENPLLLQPGSFDVIVGNPPFGTKISEGDLDQLDGRSLSEFDVSRGKRSVQSELVILEHSIEMLKPGGRLGMVLPDGVLNNSGSQSNCPDMRTWLFRNGRIRGVVSLPDYAFRRSGATNKTSILFFEKYSDSERLRLESALAGRVAEQGIGEALVSSGLDYEVFFAEADHIGYTPSGMPSRRNDLFNPDGFCVGDNQEGTILGAWRSFLEGARKDDPRCAYTMASKTWDAHSSHRIDPKYHVYQAHEEDAVPDGWTVRRLGDVVSRRLESPDFLKTPLEEFRVLTLSQTGEMRLREPGVGNNPPEWLGMYFADSPSTWYTVHAGDIVYSGIDLWKGVICYATPEFEGGLVTSEYPVLRVVSEEVSPEFLALLLRTERFKRVFRAINTGHSNRRRTQASDFEDIRVYFPHLSEQQSLARPIIEARQAKRHAFMVLDEVQASFDCLLGAC